MEPTTMGHSFTCAKCHRQFISTRSPEEATLAAERELGRKFNKQDAMVDWMWVCGNCVQIVKKELDESQR